MVDKKGAQEVKEAEKPCSTVGDLVGSQSQDGSQRLEGASALQVGSEHVLQTSDVTTEPSVWAEVPLTQQQLQSTPKKRKTLTRSDDTPKKQKNSVDSNNFSILSHTDANTLSPKTPPKNPSHTTKCDEQTNTPKPQQQTKTPPPVNNNCPATTSTEEEQTQVSKLSSNAVESNVLTLGPPPPLRVASRILMLADSHGNSILRFGAPLSLKAFPIDRTVPFCISGAATYHLRCALEGKDFNTPPGKNDDQREFSINSRCDKKFRDKGINLPPQGSSFEKIFLMIGSNDSKMAPKLTTCIRES